MKKHGIRAPRKPRGEAAAITIGNQDKQIQLLIDRCCTLENDNRKLQQQRDDADAKYLGQFGQSGDILLELGKVQTAYTRMLGWQDCARELLCGGRRVEITGRRLEPFPSTAPGV